MEFKWKKKQLEYWDNSLHLSLVIVKEGWVIEGNNHQSKYVNNPSKWN
jgi:hypothetical protein